MASESKNINLILGHGGARALAHIGIIKGLLQEDYVIRSLIGTSMGAIVAWYYIVSDDFNNADSHLEDFCLHIHSFLTFRFPHGIQLNVEKLRAYLIAMQGGTDLSFSDLRIPLSIGVTDAKTGKLVFIDQGSVVDALIATSMFPIWNKPYRIKDRDYFDGGLTDIPLHHIPFHFVNAYPYLYINILNSFPKSMIKNFFMSNMNCSYIVKSEIASSLETMKDITSNFFQIDLLIKNIHTVEFHKYKEAILFGKDIIDKNKSSLESHFKIKLIRKYHGLIDQKI